MNSGRSRAAKQGGYRAKNAKKRLFDGSRACAVLHKALKLVIGRGSKNALEFV
jgi:hypothetical protein